MDTELTREVVQAILPGRLNRVVTDEMIDQWNVITSDPDMAVVYRENFISYTKVLDEGKFKIDDYLHAVMYCSHRIAGTTSKDSYIRVFPQKYASWITRGLKENVMSSYISSYNTSKLVRLIMQQSTIPVWVMNQDVAQNAINVLASLMTTADSEKVRCDSANALLNHLKKPDSIQVDLNVGVKEDSALVDLQRAMRDLALVQTKAITGGVNVTQIAEAKLITGEVVDHEPD